MGGRSSLVMTTAIKTEIKENRQHPTDREEEEKDVNDVITLTYSLTHIPAPTQVESSAVLVIALVQVLRISLIF